MTDKHFPSKKKTDERLTLLTGLYFAGVFLGVILCGVLDSDKLAVLNGIAGSLVSDRLGNSFRDTLVNSFAGGFLLLVLCFWLGLSAAAQPLELLVPVFRGLGAGVSLSGMYAGYGSKGVGMAAVLIVPGAVLSAFALIIAAREALEMSGSVFSAAFGKAQAGEKIDIRLYFTKFVILCAMLAAASFADSLAAMAFAFLKSKGV